MVRARRRTASQYAVANRRVTAKARLEALLDSGADESDEALAALVGCKITTIKDYRQEWQRRNGICGQRLRIPPDAERELIALRNDGLTFPVVAQAVEEQFGIHLTAAQARTIYRSGSRIGALAPIPAVVDAEDLPLETQSGLMWCLSVKPPRGQWVKKHQNTCDVCPLRDRCEQSLTDPLWYCACERPLVWEVPEASSPATSSSPTTD